MRKGRLLLALAAVKGARAAGQRGDPDAHRITVCFAQAVQSQVRSIAYGVGVQGGVVHNFSKFNKWLQ